MAKGTNNKKGANLTPLLLIGAFLLLNKDKGAKLIAPVKGTITSGFGTRSGVFHNGVDISVPAGTALASPAAGTILSVYNNAAGGNQVLIKHTNGYTTGYAHLTNAILKVGDKVAKGDIFAYSGNTGTDTTGAHLHFTLKNAAGVYLDPAKYVVFS